ncbi:hypothetical protein [Streptomyces sp. NPDC059639]|uniref:hypothetical protein n=1 Tax=Streptomyces sp. NPDC059639 TaxID=3346891 RepID=UPI0036C37EE3
MSGSDSFDGGGDGRGGGSGVGTDVPRVPVGAGAWGASSEEALALTATEPAGPETALDSLAPLDALDAELLHEPDAWRKLVGAEDASGADQRSGQGLGQGGADGKGKGKGEDQGQSQGTGTGKSAEPAREQRPRSATEKASGAANSRTAQRRSGVDPVKVLMHHHRELCERAVDPLEIAAGLEAHGLTDRTAARYRHKDVFSLAEEMYARMPRDGEPAAPAVATPAPTSGVRGAWAGLALLPGAVCALALLALNVTTGTPHLAVAFVGALAIAAALRTTLRHGPLRTGTRRPAPTTRLWVWSLLLYAAFGDGLLDAALAGGPDGAWAPAAAPLLALAVAVAPATWCARLFAAGARRRLAASRGLAEFTSSVRPLLLGCVLLFALALTALLGAAGALLDQGGLAGQNGQSGQGVDYAGACALGVLLLLARLLSAHGRTYAPAVVLGAAAGAEVLAVATVFAARLPGCAVLGTPVESAVDAVGVGVVPGTACAVAALALLVHATRTLTRASVHASTDSRTGAP